MMHSVTRSDWSFVEIEARITAALEEQRFAVQRTFSLLSAVSGTHDLGDPGTG